MDDFDAYIGLDVHKDTVAVALAAQGRGSTCCATGAMWWPGQAGVTRAAAELLLRGGSLRLRAVAQGCRA